MRSFFAAFFIYFFFSYAAPTWVLTKKGKESSWTIIGSEKKMWKEKKFSRAHRRKRIKNESKLSTVRRKITVAPLYRRLSSFKTVNKVIITLFVPRYTKGIFMLFFLFVFIFICCSYSVNGDDDACKFLLSQAKRSQNIENHYHQLSLTSEYIIFTSSIFYFLVSFYFFFFVFLSLNAKLTSYCRPFSKQ